MDSSDPSTLDLAKVNEELALFRQFVEAAGQGFSMADLDGSLLYLNPALCRMLDLEGPEDYLGRHLSICYPDEVNRRASAEIEQALMQHGRWEGELDMLTRQGKIVPTWHSSFVIRDQRGNPARMAVVITDITERIASEKALRASEEGFRAVFEEAPVGMVIGAGDGAIVRANREMCRMSGYSQEEFVGRHVRDFTHPEDRDLSTPQLQKLASGEIPAFTLQKRFIRKDGAIRWTQATTTVVIRPAEMPLVAIGVVEDITERKEAEDALRQSHDELRAIYDCMFDGLLIVDLETHRYVKANASICRMLGYTEAELLSMTTHDIHPAEEVPRALERIRGRAEGLLQGHVEAWLLRKDGSILCADAVGSPLTYGGRPCVVAFFRDITEQRKAEDALRESEEKYRLLVETSPDAVLMTDLEGRITFASRRAAELYGSEDIDELIGRNPLEFLAPESRPIFFETRQRTLERGVMGNIECVFLRKDGSCYNGEASAAVVRDAAGAPHGFVVIVRDITERKEAQKALERERRTLQHMLRASDHERRLIAYDIHDGLAQELAGALMQFQVYDRSRKTNAHEAARLFETGLTMLKKSHAEARRLISGVRPPILDESGVVAAVAHLVFDPAYEAGPKIDLRNRVRFQRLAAILENVIYRIVQEGLSNARKHSKSDRIVVSLIQRGDRLRIAIRDWGVGFDPTATRQNHFGIEGIRQRARLLGGSCSIQSKPGKGTRILVELPVMEKEAGE